MPADHGIEPGTPLSVAQAAELAGVSEADLRLLMEQGQLLFEVQRQGGQEQQVVRFVDLMEAFPERLGPQGAAEAPEKGPGGASRGAPNQGSKTAARTDGPAETSTGSAPRAAFGTRADGREERKGASGSGADSRAQAAAAPEIGAAPSRTPGEDSHGHGSGHDPRLVALQDAQRMLEGQLVDLAEQRTRLRDQGDDLRQRLTRVEQERQASTAGLLVLQQRLLELESGPVVTLRKPAHRQPWLWGTAALGLVLLWSLRSMSGMRASFAEESQRCGETAGLFEDALEEQLQASSEQRAAALQERAELEGRLQQREQLMEQAREEARREREGFAAALDQQTQAAEQLQAALEAELRREREGSLAVRQDATKRIEALQAAADQAWLRLDEERQRARLAVERQEQATKLRLDEERAARLALGQRMDELGEQLRGTTAHAKSLERELGLAKQRDTRRQRLVEVLGRQSGNLPRSPLELALRLAREGLLAPAAGDGPKEGN